MAVENEREILKAGECGRGNWQIGREELLLLSVVGSGQVRGTCRKNY